MGGIAALRIYRYKGKGPANIVSGWHNPWGYGLYFTDNRLLGVSYTKYLSRAYIPAWILSIGWVVIWVSEVAWARMTNSENAPLWFLPILFGTMVASLVFLLYLSPRRASTQIESLAVNSIWDLEILPKDVVLQRGDISQVTVEGTRVHDPGRSWVSGSIITLSLKTGETVVFVNTLDREKSRRLFQLFQNFCAQDPSISFFVK